MSIVIDGTSYLTVKMAAEALATTEMRVLMLMREKELIGVQLEGEWLVTADSVAGCLAKPPGPKAVADCASGCASVRGCACKG